MVILLSEIPLSWFCCVTKQNKVIITQCFTNHDYTHEPITENVTKDYLEELRLDEITLGIR